MTKKITFPTPEQVAEAREVEAATEAARAAAAKRATALGYRPVLLRDLHDLLREGGGPWRVPAHRLGLEVKGRHCTYAEVLRELPEVVEALKAAKWEVTDEEWPEPLGDHYASIPSVYPSVPMAAALRIELKRA